MLQIYSNIAHLCNGCAIAYFLLSAWKIRQESAGSYIRRMLSDVLFFWFFLQLKDIIFLNEAWWQDDYISGIVKMVDMMLIPVLFIFFKSCVKPHGLRMTEKLLYLMGNFVFLILYILFPSREMFDIGMLYSLSLGVVAYITILKACRRKEKHIEENYSYLENISPKWIVRSLTALFICLISWELIFFRQDTWWGDSVYYLLSIVIWGYIERQAMDKQEVEELETLSEENPLLAESLPCQEEQEKTPVYLELEQKLDTLMTEEKLYLRPQLNISELSQALGTNRTYLSAFLNGKLGKTFYDYVNELRLNHAITLLQEKNAEDEESYSLKEIAEMSGFNSISTFNRQFHARYNMSPSTWRQKNA